MDHRVYPNVILIKVPPALSEEEASAFISNKAGVAVQNATNLFSKYPAALKYCAEGLWACLFYTAVPPEPPSRKSSTKGEGASGDSERVGVVKVSQAAKGKA